MNGVLSWVRSIVFYLIFTTLIVNMLPDRKYEKYLRLFVGMVLVFLVFEPFADISGMEAQVAGAFERITFQNDAALLRKEIDDADGKRMERLADQYEEAIENDIMNMAGGNAVLCKEVQVVLERENGGEFGKILGISVELGVREAENQSSSDAAVPVDTASGEKRRLVRQNANREISELKKKIGEYYGLEESYITVNLENE